jgi:two-component system, cell cycle response regulator CpdR
MNESRRLTPLRVLLAEDDEGMRSFLAEVLRSAGYEVLEVADGRQLFWMIEQARVARSIDLVVSDLRMPLYDGIEVLEAWAEAGPTPVGILMTGYADDATRARARRLGLALLEKPFTVERLLTLARSVEERGVR